MSRKHQVDPELKNLITNYRSAHYSDCKEKAGKKNLPSVSISTSDKHIDFKAIIYVVVLCSVALIFLIVLKKENYHVKKILTLDDKKGENFEIMCRTLLIEKCVIATEIQEKIGRKLPLIKDNIVKLTNLHDGVQEGNKHIEQSVKLIEDANKKIDTISYKLLSEKLL